MASAHKALGRGLEALFAASSAAKTKPADPAVATAAPVEPANIVREIPVEKIRPNRHQPRTYFDLEALEELSQSIKQHGLAQPLLVTETATPGEYELVAGERRLRASKLAGLASVPCTVKKLSNRDRFEVALIENIQRQDLNALEEAVALDGLMREYSLTQEDVANAIGKSRSSVANMLRFLKLHENVQTALRSGAISEGHAKCLAGVSEHAEQLRLLEKITSEQLSVRELEALIGARGVRKPAASAAAKHVPVEVQRYQDELQRTFGRKVELQTNGKKGWLKFEFYTPEDLDELCQKFGLKL
jgi:ParB family chromosome partitioning protein